MYTYRSYKEAGASAGTGASTWAGRGVGSLAGTGASTWASTWAGKGAGTLAGRGAGTEAYTMRQVQLQVLWQVQCQVLGKKYQAMISS